MDILELLNRPWQPPELPADIPHGDMPGDKVVIGGEHIAKANTLFPPFLRQLGPVLSASPVQRAVVAVCGGSGVGKSETASLLSYYLRAMGVGSSTLSGDNYPHRIPRDNDAERVRVYRTGGLRGLVAAGLCTPEVCAALRSLWLRDTDAEPAQADAAPWLSVYQRAGRRALSGYLGTPGEIDFDEVSGIIARFKQGAPSLMLKRMGRETAELWYDEVDVRDTQVLIIEWTHGNSDFIEGVDIPILLNSTPQETLAHRRERSRDGKPDSAFITMVLELEQRKLESQAHKARLILSKSGELLTYDEYRHLMAGA